MPAEQTATETTPDAVATTATLATVATEVAPDAKGPDTTVTDPAATLATNAEEAGGKPTEETPKVEGAPETYEAFAAPEGVELPTTVLDVFQGAARKLNLNQKQAQEFLNDLAPVVAKQNSKIISETHQKAVTQWLKETKADTEFGGDNLDANLAIARRAMDPKIATPALRKLLDDSGLGNHPEVIRWMYRVGKNLAPDQKHISGATQTGGEKSPSEVLWPTQAQ